MPVRFLIITLIAPVLWGTTYFVTTQYMPPGKPLLLGALRALPAALLLMLHIRKFPERKWWFKIFWLSVFNILLFFGLFFYAAYRLPGGVAATLGAFNPFFVALFAWPILHQKPKKHTIIAALLGLAGVALLVLTSSQPINMAGVAAAVGATLALAPGTVLTKKWVLPHSATAATTWQLLIAGIVLLILSLMFETPFPHFKTDALWGVAYLSFAATGLAYVLWFFGLQKIKPHIAAILTLSTPVVAVIIDWILLHKTLSIRQMAGGVLIIVAIIFETYKQKKAAQRQPSSNKSKT